MESKDLRNAYKALTLVRADLLATKQAKAELEERWRLRVREEHSEAARRRAELAQIRETFLLREEDFQGQLLQLQLAHAAQLRDLQRAAHRATATTTKQRAVKAAKGAVAPVVPASEGGTCCCHSLSDDSLGSDEGEPVPELDSGSPPAHGDDVDDDNETVVREKLGLLAMLYELKQRVQAQHEQLAMQEACFAQERGDWGHQAEELRHQVTQLQVTLLEINNEKQFMEERFEFLRAEVDVIREERDGLRAQCEAMTAATAPPLASLPAGSAANDDGPGDDDNDRDADNSRAKETMEAQASTIAGLEDELLRLKTQREVEASEHSEAMTLLQQANTILKADVETRTRALGSCREQLQKLRSVASALQSELTTLRQVVDDERHAWGAMIEQAHGDLSQVTGKHDVPVRSLDSGASAEAESLPVLRQPSVELRHDLTRQSSERQRMKDEIDDLREKLRRAEELAHTDHAESAEDITSRHAAAHASDVERLRADLEMKESHILRVEELANVGAQELANSQSRLQEALSTIEQLSLDLEMKEKRLLTVKEQADARTQELEHGSLRLQEALSTIEGLRLELETKEQHLETAQEQSQSASQALTAATLEVARLQEALGTSESRCEESTRRLVEQQKVLGDARDQIAQLEEKLQNHQHNMQGMHRLLEDSRVATQQQEETTAALRDELVKAQAASTTLELRLRERERECQEEIEILHRTYRALEAETAEAQLKAEQEMATLTLALQEKDAELDNLRAAAVALDAEHARERVRIEEELRTQRDAATHARQQLLDQHQRELGAARAAVETLSQAAQVREATHAAALGELRSQHELVVHALSIEKSALVQELEQTRLAHALVLEKSQRLDVDHQGLTARLAETRAHVEQLTADQDEATAREAASRAEWHEERNQLTRSLGCAESRVSALEATLMGHEDTRPEASSVSSTGHEDGTTDPTPMAKWQALATRSRRVEDFLPQLQLFAGRLQTSLGLCADNATSLAALTSSVAERGHDDDEHTSQLVDDLVAFVVLAEQWQRLFAERALAEGARLVRRRVLGTLAQWCECLDDGLFPRPAFGLTSHEVAMVLESWTPEPTRRARVTHWLVAVARSGGNGGLALTEDDVDSEDAYHRLTRDGDAALLELRGLTREVKDAFRMLIVPTLTANPAIRVRVFTRRRSDPRRSYAPEDPCWEMRLRVQPCTPRLGRSVSTASSPSSSSSSSSLSLSSTGSSTRLQIIQEHLARLQRPSTVSNDHSSIRSSTSSSDIGVVDAL